IGYIEQTEAEMQRHGIGKFESISGRYYAMDQDKHWERVQLAYDAVNDGVGPKFEQPTSVVEEAYEKEIYDEFVEPSVIVDKDGQPVGPVKDNDAMIFFNFRPDRAIQLSKCFANDSFSEVKRHRKQNNYFVQMTPYSEEVHGDVA